MRYLTHKTREKSYVINSSPITILSLAEKLTLAKALEIGMTTIAIAKNRRALIAKAAKQTIHDVPGLWRIAVVGSSLRPEENDQRPPYDLDYIPILFLYRDGDSPPLGVTINRTFTHHLRQEGINLPLHPLTCPRRLTLLPVRKHGCGEVLVASERGTRYLEPL